MPNPDSIQVLLDDGTGTFPTDVTSRQEGDIDLSEYGRTDYFDQPQSAQMVLTLDNTDGGLTAAVGGGGGFGLGPFGLTPFGLSGGGGGGTPLFVGQGIRLAVTEGATTVNVATMTIRDIELEWPGGAQSFATATITATDAMTDLSRRPMRPMAEEQVLLNSPGMFYTLGEAVGSTSAGDTSGNQQTPLVFTNITGGPTISPVPAFGVDIGLPGGQTGAQFTGHLFDTMIMTQAVNTGTFSSSSISYTFAVVCGTPGGPLGQDWNPVAITAHGGGSGGPRIDDNGKVNWNGALSGNVCDGLPHVVTAQAGGGLPTDIWVDGTLVASGTVMSSTWTNGFISIIGNLTTGVTSIIGEVSIGPRLANADVADIHDGLVNGFAGDSTDDRLARLASYAGITSTTDTPSGQVLGSQDTAGASLFDAMAAVATAEGGVLFIDGDGDLTMQGRYHRTVKVSANLSLGELEAGDDTTVVWDDLQKITQVTVTRTGGAQQVYPTLAPGSLVYPQSLDLIVDTDEHALNAAQWVVGKHGAPAPRIGSVTFDLKESPNAEALLGLQIGDRIDFTGLPSQTWSGATAYTVEGWSMKLSDEAWQITANLLPWSLFEAFILNDSTYGVLDGPVPIGY